MVAYPELAAIRLGHGLSTQMPPPSGPDEILASVQAAGPDGETITLNQIRKMRSRLAELKRNQKKGGKDDKGASEAVKKERRRANQRAKKEALRRIARAVDDPFGFGERLVQFWADHFTIAGNNIDRRLMAAAYVNEAIRPHISGKFADMLFAAETHPGMLVYLNQDRSVGPNSRLARRKKDERTLGLNENLAREMIELHSLGVGANYSQEDVRQLAKLLTGLVYNPRRDKRFQPNRAEPGAETVLGQSYGGNGPAKLRDIRAVIGDLARHPATAQHLARKLVTHFISDEPPQPMVDRLAAVYTDSDGDLSAVNAALVEAPELETHFRSKVRQPFDFIVTSLRGLGITGEQVMALKPGQAYRWLIQPMTSMGQKWGQPDGPNGWPEAAGNWATPQGLAARIDWAMRIPPKLRPDLPDPRQLLQAALGDTASEALQWAVPKAESAQEGIAIVLASADFNRR